MPENVADTSEAELERTVRTAALADLISCLTPLV